MHCKSCDAELTDFEATRKDSNGDFIDLCNHCYGTVAEDIDSDVRMDLMHSSDEDYTDYTDYDDYSDIHDLDFN